MVPIAAMRAAVAERPSRLRRFGMTSPCGLLWFGHTDTGPHYLPPVCDHRLCANAYSCAMFRARCAILGSRCWLRDLVGHLLFVTAATLSDGQQKRTESARRVV